ncbi:MAG: bifunctional folylpolyglutamate synthase/dihydrofolate synthase, partial [Chloroflexota bacterium]|nr:bifunctional folylpolyglutamate synthase/dihydrofolate synthase [Chloroflexota bacterium]
MPSIADYGEAVAYLLALVDHERQTPFLPRQKRIYDLRRVTGFLESLGNPHLATPAVHIAGTKGKGSTAAMVDAIAAASGYRTGFYSSPHLHTFRERIRLDGAPVDEGRFAELVALLAPVAGRLEQETDLGAVTLFEFMTAMAFQCFARERVELQTVEVGLGGRLDATNVVQPEVCAITSISMDHMAILGDTLEEIAGEKAGILKQGIPAVVGPQRPEALAVVLDAAKEKGAPVVQVGEDLTWELIEADANGQSALIHGRLDNYCVKIPLLGSHQLENAATAVGIAEVLIGKGWQISDRSIRKGLAQVSWPCRLEVLDRRPWMVSDGAHNVYSMETMLHSLRRYFQYDRLLVVAGFSRDKSVGGMAEALSPEADMVIATRSRHPRSMAPKSLADLMRQAGIQRTGQSDTVSQALELARGEAGPNDLILVTGSLFVAAEAREEALGIEPELYPDLLAPD